MEPTVSSETSAIRTQTPGNYPKRKKLHLEHGENLKTRRMSMCFVIIFYWRITVKRQGSLIYSQSLTDGSSGSGRRWRLDGVGSG